MKNEKAYFLTILFLFFSHFFFSQSKSIPRDTSYTAIATYKKVMKYFPYAKLVRDTLSDNLIAYTDLVYSKIPHSPYGKRELKLNIYRKKDKKTYPAVIFVHGGAWCSGNKTMEIPHAQRIAEYGYVTIPVEYRLSPEATYPAALYDLKTAIRWIRKNAKKYGIDASQIAISGTSAGGQLAALVGMTNGSTKHEEKSEYTKFSSDVQAVIDMDGTLNFTKQSNIDETNENIRKLGGELPKNAIWLGGSYDDAKQTWKEASPLFNVTEKSAPICFINSINPRYRDGREELIEKLNNYNIYSEKHQIEVNLHPFWLFYPWFNDVVKYSVHFLDKTLKEKTENYPHK